MANINTHTASEGVSGWTDGLVIEKHANVEHIAITTWLTEQQQNGDWVIILHGKGNPINSNQG